MVSPSPARAITSALSTLLSPPRSMHTTRLRVVSLSMRGTRHEQEPRGARMIRVDGPPGMTLRRAQVAATVAAKAEGYRSARLASQRRVPGHSRTYIFEGVN